MPAELSVQHCTPSHCRRCLPQALIENSPPCRQTMSTQSSLTPSARNLLRSVTHCTLSFRKLQFHSQPDTYSIHFGSSFTSLVSYTQNEKSRSRPFGPLNPHSIRSWLISCTTFPSIPSHLRFPFLTAIISAMIEWRSTHDGLNGLTLLLYSMA